MVSVNHRLISILSVSVKALEMLYAVVAEALAPRACNLKADDLLSPLRLGPFFFNSLLLLYLLPLSCFPLLPPLLDICRCVPQLKFRNTVSGNFYLPHSSTFLRTHGQIISSSVFIKNKILKYKVSQLLLKTPILKKLPDVIRQMPDSK